MGILINLSIFVLGAILGSYLNSWMWRDHNNKWSFGGRSVCVHCGRQLAWWENIPLFSFLFLKGKCRTCGGIIPASYFWVELMTGVLFVLVAWNYKYPISNIQYQILFFRNLFFTALLVVVFVYDLKYQIILSGIAWGGTIVALAINYSQLLLTPYSLLTGMAVGGGFFLAQYIISKGRWIGGGDVRLGVLMGALLGWPNILVALFISYILGAGISVGLLINKKVGMKSQIPFGTFLAVGTFVAMLWGNQIVEWYLSLLS